MLPIKNIVRQYKNITISGIILLFCTLGFIFGVIPAAQKVQSLLAETRTLSNQSKKLQSKLNGLNALDEESLRQQLETVISAVPSDKSLPTVFSTIEGVAAQSGVSILSISIGGDTKLASQSSQKLTAQEKQLGTKTIPFSVVINGSLDAIQRFITLAPQVRRLLRIRTFAISFLTVDQPVSISLEMDTFYQPMPKAVGTADSELPILTEAELSIIAKISQFGLASGSDFALPPPNLGQMKFNPFSP